MSKSRIHYLTVGRVLKVGIWWKFKLITNFLVPWIKPTNYSHHENTGGFTLFRWDCHCAI